MKTIAQAEIINATISDDRSIVTILYSYKDKENKELRQKEEVVDISTISGMKRFLRIRGFATIKDTSELIGRKSGKMFEGRFPSFKDAATKDKE